jgi:hypothetical protein
MSATASTGIPTTGHHVRVPPQESPPKRAAGARRIVVTILRHVPHSSAPSSAEIGRARDRRSRFARLRLDGPRRRSARQRPIVVPLRYSGRSGQPRVDSTTTVQSLRVNAGLSCVDERDMGLDRECERKALGSGNRLVQTRTRTYRSMGHSVLLHVCLLDKLRARRSSAAPRTFTRRVPSMRSLNESRYLRPLLL